MTINLSRDDVHKLELACRAHALLCETPEGKEVWRRLADKIAEQALDQEDGAYE